MVSLHLLTQALDFRFIMLPLEFFVLLLPGKVAAELVYFPDQLFFGETVEVRGDDGRGFVAFGGGGVGVGGVRFRRHDGMGGCLVQIYFCCSFTFVFQSLYCTRSYVLQVVTCRFCWCGL